VILGFIGTRQVYFRGHLLISPKTLPTRRSSRPAFRFVRERERRKEGETRREEKSVECTRACVRA
jgi:hypothetical protein